MAADRPRRTHRGEDSAPGARAWYRAFDCKAPSSRALAARTGTATQVVELTHKIVTDRLRVTNVRDSGINRLTRHQAQELQRVFRLGQQVAATHIDLEKRGSRVRFTMTRNGGSLISGILDRQEAN